MLQTIHICTQWCVVCLQSLLGKLLLAVVGAGLSILTHGGRKLYGRSMAQVAMSDAILSAVRDEAECNKVPTFLYVMPTDETHIFLEETSLVGRPSVTIGECERRLEVRLKHRGIKIKKV